MEFLLNNIHVFLIIGLIFVVLGGGYLVSGPKALKGRPGNDRDDEIRQEDSINR